MTDSKAELVRSFLRAIVNGGDEDCLREILTDDVRWNVPQSVMPKFRGPHIGHAAVINLVGDAGDAFYVAGTAGYTIMNMLIDGDQAAVQCRLKARMSAGPSYDNIYAFFFRFAGDKIAEIREHVDMGYIYGLLRMDPMNPEKTFFTADTHFGHANILLYCKRPWSDVDAMDAGLIANWNAVVPADGIVYHVGDLSFRNAATTRHILAQLNGRIFLISGNHDRSLTAATKARFENVHEYHELKIDGQRIVLFHFPIENWNNIGMGAWHLHGHSHGRTLVLGRRVDVGVDCWNWSPVSYLQLAAQLKDRPIEMRDPDVGILTVSPR